jgi:peroxiredoxin
MLMKKLLITVILMAVVKCYAQNYILKPGDHFPDITLHPIINAPVKALYLNSYTSKKYFLINFWGTWCSPCIPEMEALAKLQNRFHQQIQIIGLSNDPKKKLEKYIAKKPSKLWLASDTSFLLYKMMNLASVGNCAIVDEKRNIIAIVNTDSVNTNLISRLLAGKKINSSALIAEVSHTDKDPFGVDSLKPIVLLSVAI